MLFQLKFGTLELGASTIESLKPPENCDPFPWSTNLLHPSTPASCLPPCLVQVASPDFVEPALDT